MPSPFFLVIGIGLTDNWLVVTNFCPHFPLSLHPGAIILYHLRRVLSRGF